MPKRGAGMSSSRRLRRANQHMDLDTTLLLTMACFFLANLVQGFTGFGVGIVAMTGLTFIGEIVHATYLVNLTAVITTGAVFGRLWRQTSWRHLWPVLLGIVVSNPIGLALLKTFGPTHPEIVKRVLGAVIMGFAAWSLLGRTFKPSKMRWQVGLGVGALGGILGGAFTMSGPPLVAYIYSLPMSRDAMKASVNACFLFNCVYRLMLLISAGDVTRPLLIQSAYCVPAVVAGVVVGMILARGVGTDRFRRIAWWGFGLMGLLLVAR